MPIFLHFSSERPLIGPFCYIHSMLMTITLKGPGSAELPQILDHPADESKSHAHSFGTSHVFFPVLEPDCCAAFLLEVDPLWFSKREGPYLEGAPQLSRHFNHRAYSANVLFALALLRTFGKDLDKASPGSFQTTLELSAIHLPQPDLLQLLLEPLGHQVEVKALPPMLEGGASSFFTASMSSELSPLTALKHLMAAVLCLDEGKLFWLSPPELADLMAVAGPLLSSHPRQEEVQALLAKGQDRIFNPFLKRLSPGEDLGFWMENANAAAAELEKGIGLGKDREEAIVWLLEQLRPDSVLDLGCGEGHLLYRLLSGDLARRVCGMDISATALQTAGKKLVEWGLSPSQRAAVSLRLGNACYQDERMEGFELVVLQELLCHLEAFQLAGLLENLFEVLRPPHVIATLPNADYNALIPALEQGAFRHANHRFEWGMARIQQWAGSLAAEHGYEVQVIGIGDAHPKLGPPAFLLYFQLPTDQ